MVDTENRGCPCRRGSRGQRGPLGFSSLGVGAHSSPLKLSKPVTHNTLPGASSAPPFYIMFNFLSSDETERFYLYCWKWGVVKIFHGSYQVWGLPSHGPNVLYLDYSLKAGVETLLSRQYRSLWIPLNSHRIQWIQRKDTTSSTVNKNDSMHWFRHKGYILDTSLIQREDYSSSLNISKDMFWEIGWNMRFQAMRLWL